jgi:hypothetical protein
MFQDLPNQHPIFQFLCAFVHRLGQQKEQLTEPTTVHRYLSLCFLSGLHLRTVGDEILTPPLLQSSHQ